MKNKELAEAIKIGINESWFGIFIKVIIITIIVFGVLSMGMFAYDMFLNRNAGVIDSGKGYVNYGASSQEVIFIFNESEITLYDENYNKMLDYSSKDFANGIFESYSIKLLVGNEFCVEHKFNEVIVPDGKQIDVPREIFFEEIGYQMDCFKVNNEINNLILGQSWNIEDSEQFVKIKVIGGRE